MKLEEVLVLEILAFKIWKILCKEQNFSKLYRHIRVKSILIFNPKHYSGKYFSEFLSLTRWACDRWDWKGKTSLFTSISLATQERSIVHIINLLMNFLWQCIFCNHKAYKHKALKKIKHNNMPVKNNVGLLSFLVLLINVILILGFLQWPQLLDLK